VHTVTGCDDPEFAQLDAYIRAQLARAAESYGSSVDVDARLEAVLAAGTHDSDDDTAAR
jgi:hypothetical protein